MSPQEGRSLTLFEITRELQDLMDARDDALEMLAVAPTQADVVKCQADIDACEAAIKVYVTEQIRKVDSIYGFWRNTEAIIAARKEEAERQVRGAALLQKRLDRIKQVCQIVMEENGWKKLEGRTGTIMLKGNGGVAPLRITEESLIPDECCEVEGRIPEPLWKRILARCPWAALEVELKRTVSNSKVRKSLEAGPVAGAVLDERGKHVELK